MLFVVSLFCVQAVLRGFLFGDERGIWLSTIFSPFDEHEKTELVKLLNALTQDDFTKNKDLAGSTSEYGILVVGVDEDYSIFESIGPCGALEISYLNKRWWIDNDIE